MQREPLKIRRRLLNCKPILRLKLLDRTMHQNLFRRLRDGELLKEPSLSLRQLLHHIRMVLPNVVLGQLKLACVLC
jgi:hypothetical protein